MHNSTILKVLTIALSSVAVLGYGASLISIFATMLHGGYFQQSFCLQNSCVSALEGAVSSSLSIAKVTSDFLVALATVGGIVVALLSYFSSVDNSALANHIAHYSTFQDYIKNEISKRRRIDVFAVDAFYWYNMIFPGSKRGDMAVAAPYRNFMGRLHNTIQESNLLVTSATSDGFRFKAHQENVKRILLELGIQIPSQPRLEFYEIEDQLMSLIRCVNQAFCSGDGVITIGTRQYQ